MGASTEDLDLGIEGRRRSNSWGVCALNYSVLMYISTTKDFPVSHLAM